jgi:hypothetical protein
MLNIQGEIDDYLQKNKDGVFEWKEKQKWNPLYLQYFKKRDDDGLSSPSAAIVAKDSKAS